jgi:hypothetical protein
MTEVHHHRLAAHVRVGFLIARELPGIGLAAPRCERIEERVLRICGGGRRRCASREPGCGGQR